MEQRFTFDAVAELYEAARPGYPTVLFEDIWQTARLQAGDRVLEIGSGTGKATKPFAERGTRITALEPGSSLIDVARRSLGQFPHVEMISGTFEDWQLEPQEFKLVFAAQSFHWVAPDIRFSKTASALAPGGVLAVFGSTALPVADPLHAEFTRLYERFAPHLAGRDLGPGWYLPGGELAKLFDELPTVFGQPIHKVYSWSRMHTAQSYVDQLRTESHCQMLAAEMREGLLAGIGAAVNAHGGTFEHRHETHLYMTRRS